MFFRKITANTHVYSYYVNVHKMCSYFACMYTIWLSVAGGVAARSLSLTCAFSSLLAQFSQRRGHTKVLLFILVCEF